jgi:hypothetical protein
VPVWVGVAKIQQHHLLPLKKHFWKKRRTWVAFSYGTFDSALWEAVVDASETLPEQMPRENVREKQKQSHYRYHCWMRHESHCVM